MKIKYDRRILHEKDDENKILASLDNNKFEIKFFTGLLKIFENVL